MTSLPGVVRVSPTLIALPTALALIAAVEEARSQLLHAVRDMNEAQSRFKPVDGVWSVVEIVEHLYLAELSGVTKIWTAADTVRNGVRWLDPLPNSGKPVEQIIAETWKAREIAPPIATPHIGGPLSFWCAAHATLTAMLRQLGDRLDGLVLEDVVFPHYLSGPMDARQRLEFLRFHIERHHAQAQQVMAHPAFPR
ncbi:MAG: DinB family protein [bacterium]